jgi:plastocyanin
VRLLAVLLAMAPMHGGHDPGTAVEIGYDSYGPPQIEVLAGDTVSWHNGSARKHSVKATEGGFSSPILFTGDTYRHRFDAPGVAAYYCTQHTAMRGEVHVARLLLDPPQGTGAPGRPFPLSGRAALPAGTEVRIERESGGAYVPAGATAVGDDGRFTATVTTPDSARYRAVADGTASEPVQVLVENHQLTARAVRRGRRVVVTTHATPAAPGMDVVLELRLASRFGWWPVRRARLDPRSRARFAVRTRHAVRARVLLTLPDGATPLARSGVVRARRAR